MREKIIPGIFLIFLSVTGLSQSVPTDSIPLAPQQNRKPADFHLFNYKYSLGALKENFSAGMMKNAARQYEIVKDINSKGKWKPTPESIDSHLTPEWFEDAKFGMFIDWGALVCSRMGSEKGRESNVPRLV